MRPLCFFLVLMACLLQASLCFSQNVILRTQADVDAFDPATTTITGSLSIDGPSSSDPISDLSNLSNLVLIQSDLVITNTQFLTQLNGLNSLRSVGGDLRIDYNHSLQNIDGLDNLGSTLNVLSITENDSLSQLNGLNLIDSVFDDLRITNNPLLNTLNGMVNLKSVGGHAFIRSNQSLRQFSGLSSLESIGEELDLENNTNLIQMEGFSKLTNIGQDLFIRYNDSLLNINGLHKLESIGGNLSIVQNSSLVSIDGLGNLSESIRDLLIIDNDSLKNINGLAKILSINGNVELNNNSSLKDISSLSNIDSLQGNLRIKSNDLLSDLGGLDNLKSIKRSLDISGNGSLRHIDNLMNLESIGSGFLIRYNKSLKDVDGLINLSSMTGSVIIDSNDSLLHINGLEHISSSISRLDIYRNNALENIDGLKNVVSVDGFLNINGNSSLVDVNGLENLVTVGYLDFWGNHSLTHLKGLRNLRLVRGWFKIITHSSLVDCCAIQDLLASPDGILGITEIANNPSECSSKQEVIESLCGLRFDYFLNGPCINSDNGSIQVSMRGFEATPFDYHWTRQEDGAMGSGSSRSENFTIDGLIAGTYDIMVTTPLPDTSIVLDIILNELDGSIFEIIGITSTNSSNGLSNGSLEIEIAGGLPPYEYSWSGPESGTASGVNVMSYWIPGLVQGEYRVIVTDDSGLQAQVAVTLLDETVPVFPCEQPLDIVILNDVSGSVDATEYAESKQFFVDFLNEVNIGQGPEQSRASIIEWSTWQNLKIPITGDVNVLNSYLSMRRAFSGGTSPHPAMQNGKRYLDEVSRPDVEKVLILSTDGSGGQISPSLVALADEYKAEGYHIVTIAFDNGFLSSYARDILRQVASIDLLAPGASAYSLLDQGLAKNIVNLYLCPIDPGSSATVYFNRDGAIDITDIQPVDNCPFPDQVELTFTIQALRELSIPGGMPVTFYHNDPSLFSASPILTWVVPCAIPADSMEVFTVVLPVSGPTNIFAVLNDDGTESPPIQFPITDIDELAYSNNIDHQSVCTDGQASLQAFKQTLTPTPICDSTVIYTIDVCNISEVDAFDVVITDQAPLGFELSTTTVNNNGCATVDNDKYDIPTGCCVSLTLTYDAGAAENGNYTDQDVGLSGPSNQTYYDFDGLPTTAEDVLIDGEIDCESTTITFTKEVHITETCDDAFVVYTFTIDNQLNAPLQGLSFSDILPEPVSWAFRPYAMNGLRISRSDISGQEATFVIDEVLANTVATFSMDANLGMWSADGDLMNSAMLSGVPDLENGGLQTLMSNTVSTAVMSRPIIVLPDTLFVTVNGPSVTLDAGVIGVDSIRWTTTGDGEFSSPTTDITNYVYGDEDLNNQEVSLFVSVYTECGEQGQNVLLILENPDCTTVIDQLNINPCDDQGTESDSSDDTYDVTINVSSINGGISNQYTVNDGINNYGPFNYGVIETIVLPADGITYNLTITDVDDPSCRVTEEVSQDPCSTSCALLVDQLDINPCDNQGTDSDGSDDTYEVIINVTSINGGISNQYTINDGINNYGPFNYEVTEGIVLPADGITYNLTITDVDDASCRVTVEVSQDPCSTSCALSVDQLDINPCDNQGTDSDGSDDTYDVTINVSSINGGVSNQYTVNDGINNYGPFNYDVDEVITLPADGVNYSLAITDVDDPSCRTQTEVSQNPCSSTCEMNVYYHIEDPLCPGDFGRVQIDSIVGVDGPFEYSLDGINYTALNTTLIEDLNTDDVIITFREINNTSCQELISVNIIEPMSFNIDIGVDTIIAIGESIDINPISNLDLNELTWSWMMSSDLSCDDCPNPTITPTHTMTYQVTATDINSCVRTDQITITVDNSNYDIYIPNAFTPNGDGMNDVFTIYAGRGVAEITELKIFDRWGNIVYNQSPFSVPAQINEGNGWDGRLRGLELDTGVYVYMARFTLENGDEKILSGDVTLIR